MKTFIQSAILCLALNTVLAQQVKLSPTKRAEKQTAQLTKQLNLTETQQVSIKTEKVSHFKTLHRLRSNDELRLARIAHKEKVKKRKEAQKAEIISILTADQQVKYREMEAKNQANKGKRIKRAKDRPVAPKVKQSHEQIAEQKTVRLTRKLNLTTTQKKQVKAIYLRHIKENEANKEKNKAFSKEAKEMKIKIKELRASHKQKIERMLTPQQLTNYKTMRDNKNKKTKK